MITDTIFQSSTRRKWAAGVKSITNLRAFSTNSAGAEKKDSAEDSGVGGSAEEVMEAVTIRGENQDVKFWVMIILHQCQYL